MFKKNCACGKANKNFKYDIGPFYVDECCKTAGYDDLGQRKSSGPTQPQAPTINIVPQQPSIPSQQTELSAPQQESPKPSATDRVLGLLGLGAKKLSKSKLKDLRVDELKKIAADRGCQNFEEMTRAQLTEMLLQLP